MLKSYETAERKSLNTLSILFKMKVNCKIPIEYGLLLNHNIILSETRSPISTTSYQKICLLPKHLILHSTIL